MGKNFEEKLQEISNSKNLDSCKFKRIIRESTEQTCKEKFEEYLFGSNAEYYGQKVEDDTEYEKRLFYDVSSFTSLMGTNKGEYVDAFKELLDCKNVYDDVLQPKNHETIYRGLYLDLKKMINYKWQIKEANDKQVILRVENVKWNPKREVQSWTTDKTIAERFGKVSNFNLLFDAFEGPIILIKENPKEEELIFDPEFLNSLNYKEDEIIRVGGAITLDIELKIQVRAAKNAVKSEKGRKFLFGLSSDLLEYLNETSLNQ